MGAFSFHETKNIQCGEGGALLVNNADYKTEAEIIREKGTDRSRFFRGEVDKYTWQSVGSSYLPGELLAAFLYEQMCSAVSITNMRLKIWQRYHDAFAANENSGKLRRPIIPEGCVHNAHMYYVLLPSETARTQLVQKLKELGIMAVIHYVPLHNAPAGKRFSRSHGSMQVTEDLSARLLRLPLWVGLSDEQQELVISTVSDFSR
jgi:dTDP-4-amino-4,6-dideoxygalactose transaminase